MIIKPSNLLVICLVLSSIASAQRPASGSAQTAQTAAAQTTAGTEPAPGAAFVRENYSKYEYRIPMRDGVKLFASVYVPKDVITEGKTYPILMQRTPYNVAPMAWTNTGPLSGRPNSSLGRSLSSLIRTFVAAS
jgi:predicted acyl esterase